MFRRFQVVSLALLLLAFLGAAPRGQVNSGSRAPSSLVAIIGSVVDAVLTPLPGVAIVLEQGSTVRARTTSDDKGGFRFADVAPGDYRIRATLGGYAAFAREVHVPDGTTAIRLPIVLVRPEQDPGAGGASTSGRSSGVATPPPPAGPADASLASRTGGGGGGRGGSPAGAAAPSNNVMIDGISAVDGGPQAQSGERSFAVPSSAVGALPSPYRGNLPAPTGNYAYVAPSRFQSVRERPLSTFGADVDTASYTNVRHFLSLGQLPPQGAVRIEELVNYFRFDYPEPRAGHPISLTAEIGECPWAPTHRLVLVGARAATPRRNETAGRNIVLLLDVSGSMSPPDRLPLIKTALAMFADTLRPEDRLAIVTYAGTSGVALPSTPARFRDVIQRTIASLSAGGSTNGGQGLVTAYRVAREAFIPGGINRVILATDGDFNVGIVNRQDLVQLIERERDSGVFLSVFGVGTDNLKDATMEMLADRGNGNYAYLDSLQEAQRVLVREADSTLETVAKDVKFQVEFNPAVVSSYRLLGYEDRALAARDFNDDRKDGGEMGAGHTVTVLYEVVPVGAETPDRDRSPDAPNVDPLRYQPARSGEVTARPTIADQAHSDEWLTVKVRYKAPEGDESELLTQAVRAGGRVQFLPFASAIAEYGMLLRGGSRDVAMWDDLSRRVNAMSVTPGLAADKTQFGELVSIAKGLSRLR